jgi:hypothetical protein
MQLSVTGKQLDVGAFSQRHAAPNHTVSLIQYVDDAHGATSC